MKPAILSLILATLLFAACGEGSSQGIAKLVHYRSPVDDSDQAYGVYIPGGSPPERGYSVALHAHGYGWSVHSNFSQWQKDWADAHRWILVQLNARGPNFYWGIGDVATREVIDDLDLRFGIDRKRVYITGGSMGGTGAFRQGIVHPDLIAAAVGVDGWTDYREWHWHWYARKDQRDDIEEFRRPLLEAASPTFIAERAQWGDVHVVADARDTVVYPWQGVDLANRLHQLRQDTRGNYAAGLTVNPTKGHGGGYNLPWIYDYFLGKQARPERGSFRIASTVLNHGEMYWGRMERLHFQGQKALLECSSSLHDSVGVVDVISDNLDGFSLHIALSPVGDCDRIQVYADGIPAYDGPPGELTFEVVRDAEDELVGWVPLGRQEFGVRSQESGDGNGGRRASWERSPSATSVRPPTGLRKTRELCGPVGHAFVSPFKVCYGTVGPEDAQRRHRDEALAFAKGWNGFMVHGQGLEAVPEDEVADWDIERENLIIYGTLDTSRLLQRAHRVRALPVEVYADRIIVRDPLTGDRDYRGGKFGIFSAYPNPLSEGRTYLVVCSGRFAIEPDGKALWGLEFDLEKLYWGYSDYVIFNTDQRDLPHVKNVNNKPPVTCYEPGYFVEAGYFDADWQPDRFVTVDRVKRAKPERARLIHVAEVKVGETRRSLPVLEKVDGTPGDPPRKDLGRPILAATVKIVASDGKPVRQARVTGRWIGSDADALSRPTMNDGVAHFPYFSDEWERPLPEFLVLNVMATGAAYDFEADALRGSFWQTDDGTLAIKPKPLRQRIDSEFPALITVELGNLSEEPASIVANLLPPCGEAKAAQIAWRLEAGEQARKTITWRPDPTRPGGRYRGIVQAFAEGRSIERPIEFILPQPRALPIRVASVGGKDIVFGEAYEVKAKLHNSDSRCELMVPLACSIIEAGRHLPTQDLTLSGGEVGEVVWKPIDGEEPLPVGEHRVRVTVLGAMGISAVGEFVVRRR